MKERHENDKIEPHNHNEYPLLYKERGQNIEVNFGQIFRVPEVEYIKTHDSESRGQEEAGRTQRTSELFTCSTALKFVNALNKPP